MNTNNENNQTHTHTHTHTHPHKTQTQNTQHTQRHKDAKTQTHKDTNMPKTTDNYKATTKQHRTCHRQEHDNMISDHMSDHPAFWEPPSPTSCVRTCWWVGPNCSGAQVPASVLAFLGPPSSLPQPDQTGPSLSFLHGVSAKLLGIFREKQSPRPGSSGCNPASSTCLSRTATPPTPDQAGGQSSAAATQIFGHIGKGFLVRPPVNINCVSGAIKGQQQTPARFACVIGCTNASAHVHFKRFQQPTHLTTM